MRSLTYSYRKTYPVKYGTGNRNSTLFQECSEYIAANSNLKYSQVEFKIGFKI